MRRYYSVVGHARSARLAIQGREVVLVRCARVRLFGCARAIEKISAASFVLVGQRDRVYCLLRCARALVRLDARMHARGQQEPRRCAQRGLCCWRALGVQSVSSSSVEVFPILRPNLYPCWREIMKVVAKL